MHPTLFAVVLIATTWTELAEQRRGECVGPEGVIDPPLSVAIGGRNYRVEGHRLLEQGGDADSVLRIGVVSAIKDDREETQAALRAMLARFAEKKVDLVIANGDLATDEFEMENMFAVLAEAKSLVVVTIGNTESCGSFNKVAGEVWKKSPHLINGNWVRRLELDDASIVTLPGYFDRRFTHTGGASTYDANDVLMTGRIARGAPEPRVFVSHGPPQMSGKNGLDLVSDGSHVGDPAMTELIKELKITFGIFGHILEAGGRGTDLSGKKKLATGAWHNELFVNAGSLNTDPWTMLDGTTSHGMALVVEIEKKRARFEILKP